MSEVKNKKKKSSIIQVSIGVLAVIMAILIIIMMGIVSDIQGTALPLLFYFGKILSAF